MCPAAVTSDKIDSFSMICGEFCWRSYWIPVEASMIHLSRLPSQKMHLSQLSNVFVQNTKCISIVFEVVEFLWKQGQSLGFLHSKFPATNEAVSTSDRMTSLWQSGPWYHQQLWRMYQQLLGKQLYQQMYQQLLGKHTLKIFCSEFSATNEAFLWTKRHLWQIAWLSSAIEIFQAILQAWLDLLWIFQQNFGFLSIILGFDKTCGIAGTDEAAGYQEFFWIPASFISHPTESKIAKSTQSTKVTLSWDQGGSIQCT